VFDGLLSHTVDLLGCDAVCSLIWYVGTAFLILLRSSLMIETADSSETLVTTYQSLKKLNSVASGRKRTMPTERPPLVCEVSANFRGYGVLRGQGNGSRRPLISVF
jgi:hypothetical protein